MTPLRLALRDLRGSLAGLRLLAVCLFLGVAAIAGVNSLTSAVLSGLADQGQAILGGDVQVEMRQRSATSEELIAFQREGDVSTFIRMRAMVRPERGGDPLLVQLKGIDGLYPLYGSLVLQPGAQRHRPQGNEVIVAPDLAERSGLAVGDHLLIGAGRFRIVGFIETEPDLTSQGFALGPSVMMDPAGVEATGLIQPGSLYTAAYRIRTPASANIMAVRDRLSHAFPTAGLRVEDRMNAAPGTRRFLERIGQFLALVGLSALLVAGIGVANGVGSYLDSKRGVIAALKALGATSGTIFLIYLIEIAIVSIAAAFAGSIAGAFVPSLVVWLAGDAIPVAPEIDIYPGALAIAAGFGLLTAFAFAMVPLARARTVAAAALIRGGVEAPGRAPWWALVAALGAGALIAALAVFTAPDHMFAAIFAAASAGVLAVLGLLGWLVRKGAAALPRSRRPLIRLAIANLHRPAAQTGPLVLALGLAFTLFTTLAVVEGNLGNQIRSTIPERAPSFFLLDVPAAERARFDAVTAAASPGTRLELLPSLNGSVTAIGDRRVVDMAEIPEGAWFLRGDRNLTFSATSLPGGRIVEGEWWPADYRGEPLVSLDAGNARAAGLGVGDTLTVSVLGREITARIANLREVDWGRMGVNFVIVFAPGTLESAPHSMMGTATMPPDQERAFARAVADAFPRTTAVRISDVIQNVSGLMGQLATAVRAAASVAILAGLAVLIGALAASRRTRAYDNVVLKLLGASRGRILAMQAIEFALLAGIVSALALGLGLVAGYGVVVLLFQLDWSIAWGQVLATLGGGALLTLIVGLLGAWPTLSARPAAALRSL